VSLGHPLSSGMDGSSRHEGALTMEKTVLARGYRDHPAKLVVVINFDR